MTEEKTLDIYEFLDGRAYPKDTVKVYLDEQSGYEANRLQDKYNELEKSKRYTHDDKVPAIDKELASLQKQLDKLADAMRASALKVHMQGLPTHIIQSASEKVEADNAKIEDDDDKKSEAIELASLMIKSIETPDGKVDDRKFDYDGVEKLFGRIPPKGVEQILMCVNHLMLSSFSFDNVTDAGFLVKSSPGPNTAM